MIGRDHSMPRVALLIETTRSYAREVLSGVRRYLDEHGPWSTYLELRALDSPPPQWLREWDGDGILARTMSVEMDKALSVTGLPVVELRATHFSSHRPFVGMDNVQIGRMAAEHFLERGYRVFAAYSLETERFFEERVNTFVCELKAKGFPCEVLPEKKSDTAEDWEKSQLRLMNWLSQLPKPVAIFAANDQLGVRLLEACRRSGIAVPEEVAVMGAENEETLCAFASPKLSSVQLDGFSVGFAAAKLLDGLMRFKRGMETRPENVLIKPKGVVVRGSSDQFMIADQLVAHAARLIRENATFGLNVDELCRRLNVSRSTLDRRMKGALKRTPKEEILRVRFREVHRLLRETDLTVEAIASQTGFTGAQYLHEAFRSEFGVTPGDFRLSAVSNRER